MKKASSIRELTEHEIQQLCINWLRYHSFYVMRINAGRMNYEHNGKRKMVMLAERGTPDILAIKSGRCYFFEVKRPGKTPTEIQKMKMQELEEYGAKCFVIHNIMELENIYKQIKLDSWL